jgi:hypothetical protein
MNKKVLATGLLAGLIGSSAFAQVSSANVVGYNKVTLQQGGYNVYSTAFIDGDTTVSNLFGSLPTGTSISFWSAGSQSYTTITKSRAGWGTGATNVVERGAGAFLLLPAGSNYEVISSGNVPDDGVFTNYTVNGYAMISFPYTADVEFQNTAVYSNSATGDSISFWNGTGYTTYTKSRAGWGAATNALIQQGSAFFYLSTAAGAEAEVQPYTIE